jgi:membrane-associated phospholipid phosphatase
VAPRQDPPWLQDTARIVLALAAFGWLARRTRVGTVGPAEERAFRVINNLPDSLERPVWVIMQGGSLGAVAVATAIARRRRPDAAARLAVAGTAAWAAAKVAKRLVRRGRPADHLSGVTVRGAPQSGQGFPSGHAAVAATLAVIGSSMLAAPQAGVAWLLALVVGGARQYVGAHLPLDVAGGAALGIASGAIANLGAGKRRRAL